MSKQHDGNTPVPEPFTTTPHFANRMAVMLTDGAGYLAFGSQISDSMETSWHQQIVMPIDCVDVLIDILTRMKNQWRQQIAALAEAATAVKN